MGKAIIIPNVDWSGNNLGQVTTSALAILGTALVQTSGTFSAKAGGNLVNAQWSISDPTVASLSSNTGDTISITVLNAGTATLTATYNGETATKVLACSTGAITEDSLIQDMMRYYSAGTNTRSAVVLSIINASTFHGTLKNNSSTIKFGVQLKDEDAPDLSHDSSSPTSGGASTSTMVWDSGWKTQDETVSFDGNCNKNNSPAPASSVKTPNRVFITATYVSGSTGMPTLAEIKEAIDLTYYDA